MQFIGILTIQREASELNQAMERDGRRFRTNFISFLVCFIITSFAQQQPQVDNEMHVVDRREADKAL